MLAHITSSDGCAWAECLWSIYCMEGREVMLQTLCAYLHDNDKSELGCSDMPVVYVMLILVRVTRRVAEIAVSESNAGKVRNYTCLRLLCSTASWPEGGACPCSVHPATVSCSHGKTRICRISCIWLKCPFFPPPPPPLLPFFL